MYVRVLVPTVMCGAETWIMRTDERHELDVKDYKFPQSMCRVTRMDIWRNEDVKR